MNNLYIGIALDFSLVINNPLIPPLPTHFSGRAKERERGNSFFTSSMTLFGKELAGLLELFFKWLSKMTVISQIGELI
jgi:hypothetical protein